MSDIDLIPAEFRQRRQQRRLLRLSASATGVLATVALMVAALLAVATNSVTDNTSTLTGRQQAQMAQQDRLAELTLQRSSLLGQRTLLDNLHRGAAAGRLFKVVEDTLPRDQVWLSEWTFARDGETITDTTGTQPTRRHGYLIVIPAGPAQPAQETRMIRTHMTLRGEATDHAALSRFVTGMIQRTEIADVRVVRTTARQRNEVPVVGFTLAVIVSPDLDAADA